MFEKLFSVTAFAEEVAEVAQKSTEAAPSPDAMTVFGFGFGLVFIGLIAIIIICKIMGWICQLFIKEEAPKEKKVSKKNSAPAKFEIPNKGEFVAAVSAALAEELGKDATAIRILSIKKL